MLLFSFVPCSDCPSRWNRLIVYQFTQFLCEFGPRDFARAECGEMLRAHLAVDHAEIPREKLSHERHESNFRRIANASEHRFSEENVTDCDTVFSCQISII